MKIKLFSFSEELPEEPNEGEMASSPEGQHHAS